MSIKLELTGWRECVKTIQLATHIRDSTDRNFSNSKRVVDDLLDGVSTAFEFPDRKQAIDFAEECRRLGVEVSRLSDDCE